MNAFQIKLVIFIVLVYSRKPDLLFHSFLKLYQYQLHQHMLHPITKWAQRKDRVFVEIHLMDIVNQKVELTPTHLKFQGESASKKYTLELQLFTEVDSDHSKWSKTGFHLLVVLEKKDTQAPFWPRLIKSKDKNQYIQVDWAKWVDEDEEEEQDPNKGLGGFDPSQMQNFGTGQGFGGDEDDEEGNLDDLQKQEQLQGAKQKKQEQKQEQKVEGN